MSLYNSLKPGSSPKKKKASKGKSVGKPQSASMKKKQVQNKYARRV